MKKKTGKGIGGRQDEARFISLLIIGFILLALASIVFSVETRNPQYNGYYSETNAKVDATVGVVVAATYGGIVLNNGDRVCMGTVDLASPPLGVYASNPAQTSINVECAKYADTGACVGYAAGSPGLPSAAISWVSQATYTAVWDGNFTTEAGTGKKFCKSLRFIKVYPGLTFFDTDANYYGESAFYSSNRLISPGRANIAMFCWGSKYMNYTYNGTESQVVGSAQGMDNLAAVPLITQPGNYSFISSATLGTCAMIARSWVIYNTADINNPIWDCPYADPSGTLNGLSTNSDQLNITVYTGTVFNVTSFSIDPSIPENDFGGYTVTVRNDGDINMTVNPAGISFSSGFIAVSSIPVAAFDLAPGESRTITGTVGSPSNFLLPRNVTISIPYSSPDTLIGVCDDPRVYSFVIGEVTPGRPMQITLTVVVTPPGIIRGVNHNVTVNVTAMRGVQEPGSTITSPNISISKWTGTTWQCAPGWCKERGDQPPEPEGYGYNIYLTNGFQSQQRFVHCVMATQSPDCAIGHDWTVGVYRVRVELRDNRMSLYDGTDVIIKLDRYFTIFNIVCEDR